MIRTPPQSLEAEEAVLGICLWGGDQANVALDLLTSDDFHGPGHAGVFAGIGKLHHAGKAISPELVALEVGTPKSRLLDLKVNAPVAGLVRPYAEVVAEKAAFRRAIRLAEAVESAAYEEDVDTIDALLADPMSRVLPERDQVAGPTELTDLLAEDHRVDYLVPRLLARQEIVLWVGEPGSGKSTLLRQFAMCVTSGLHPIRRSDITPITALILDCQESRGQAKDALEKIARVAADRYKGRLFIEPRPQGLDLTAPRHQRWLDGLVAKCGADLVILGPLYNMVRGAQGRSKHAEETAEIAAAALSELMVRRNCALMVEAHAPHGDEMRVRGSKLWEDWPDFGFGLVPEKGPKRAMEVRRFRGDRHSHRDWPARWVQGHAGSWPWEPTEKRNG